MNLILGGNIGAGAGAAGAAVASGAATSAATKLTLVALPDAATAVPVASPLVAVTVAPAAAHVDSTRNDHCPDASAVAVPHVVSPEVTTTEAFAPASEP
jgi:hypothetical protein